ncbi:arsenate reductase ArsC [Spirosoma aerophilum]
MKNILVLCTGNSTRSQIAHGYLQHFADTAGRGESAQVYSAGVAPHGVNPLAIQVMAEDGIDISHHTSNHADEYTSLPLDYVITVCDNAREQCPFFPSTAKKVHHSFTDPSHAPGRSRSGVPAGADDKLAQFRAVRDEIKAYSQQFIEENVTSQATHA